MARLRSDEADEYPPDPLWADLVAAIETASADPTEEAVRAVEYLRERVAGHSWIWSLRLLMEEHEPLLEILGKRNRARADAERWRWR